MSDPYLPPGCTQAAIDSLLDCEDAGDFCPRCGRFIDAGDWNACLGCCPACNWPNARRCPEQGSDRDLAAACREPAEAVEDDATF